MSNETEINLNYSKEDKHVNVYTIVMLSISIFLLFLICFSINYKKCKLIFQ